MTSVQWPAFVISDPGTLARYAVPDAVRALVRLPQNTEAARRLEVIWEGLRRHTILYAQARQGTDDQGQQIRPPGEVLDKPGSGTCLDVALVLAAACLNADLPAAVIVVEPVDGRGVNHALVLVSCTGGWPVGSPTEPWSDLPDTFWDHVRDEVDLPGRDLIVLDPVGLTQTLGSARVPGTDTNMDEAARNARAYLCSAEWRVLSVVPITSRPDAFQPAPVPGVKPLRQIFWPVGEAPSPLKSTRAEFRLTPFQDRDEQTILEDVCERALESGRNQVAVLHGVGGSGKTRLALEVAERMRREGWCAGVLTEGLTDPASWRWLATVRAPLLVIVDYADGRLADAQQLFTVLRDRLGSPTVVVLTARSADGGWLEELQDKFETNGFHASPELIPLTATPDNPWRIYQATLAALKSTAGARLPMPAPGLEWTTLDLVLLGWLHGHNPEDAPASESATSRQELYQLVLNHEINYWVKTFNDVTGQPKARPNREVLAKAGAVATLRQPATSAELNKALESIAELAEAPVWRDSVARTLAITLRPDQGEPMAIRPDPVADYHLLTTFTRFPELLEACLPADLPAEAIARVTWVLNRAGQWNERGATDLILRVVASERDRWRAAAVIAQLTPGPARQALDHLVRHPECTIPLDQLSEGIALIATGLVHLGLLVDERRLAEEKDGSRRIGLLRRVSERRSLAGHRAGALAAIEEAATLLRAHVAADPVLIPILADFLVSLSERRSEVGDGAGALAAGEEALSLRRQLTETHFGQYPSDLARSLGNLSKRRSEVGDRAGALAAIEEAVALCRQLAQAYPTVTPTLAQLLNDLSDRRDEVGNRAGALKASEEAAMLYGRLDRAFPPLFTDGRARSLVTLSLARSKVGDRAGALAAIEEAAALYRQVAHANPTVFTPNLARSLGTLSLARSKTGDRAGALAAGEEALALYRRLADADPARFTPHLATSLVNLAGVRSLAGDW